jgi:class 3 adenylate cyclase/predicted ATPase
MDVAGWLRSLGLGQYEEKFRDNRIDTDVLPQLTADDLKDIGVSAVGDRRRLLAAIAVLAGATPSANVPASVAKSAPRKGAEISAERRPITVMFCDLAGSTSLAAKLDAEDWRNLVNAYLDEAQAAVTGLGGHVLKKLGDGLMALFGYPQAQENDAERAVRAALAIQRALAEINARNAGKGAPELSARIGIESGPVVVDATGEVFGDAPNVAARVQAAAEPGSVLITLNVQRQVAGLFVAQELGAHELRGVSDPVQLFRIVRASGAGRRGGARAQTPFVGREDELGLLMRRWERARGGEGQLVLIVGEPGLGKSRLLDEFHSQLAETPHTWGVWSASQLLQNTPLHPITEWGRLRFGGAADVPAEQRLAELEGTLRLIGLDPAEHAPLLAPVVDVPLPPGRAASFPPEELRRRQLASMVSWTMASARSQTLVRVFEDLHWADPTSLDLMRALAERCAQAPILILATARPEFRTPWGMRSHHSVISLSPLDREQVRKMVGQLASRHALSKEIVEGVSERTGGVPLFVEEVTRLVLERGVDGDAHGIPPTLQQSLAARLDRLGAAREAAQIGAVLGRDFAYPLLQAVADLDEPALQASLERLAEADLVLAEGAPPQATYRFKHALIQDAAYESLLKSRRQELHARVAQVLEERFPETASAESVVLAHHCSKAGLVAKAVEYHEQAGRRAIAQSAVAEALAQFGAALELLQDLPRSEEHLRRELGIQIALGSGNVAAHGFAARATGDAYRRASALCEELGETHELFPVLYGLCLYHLYGAQLPDAKSAAQRLLKLAETAGDRGLLFFAHRAAGVSAFPAGDFSQARFHLEQALTIWDSGVHRAPAFVYAFDPRVVCLDYLSRTLLPLGLPEQALAANEAAVCEARLVSHPNSLALPLFFGGVIHQILGDREGVEARCDELAQIAADAGFHFWQAGATVLSGWALAEAGDLEAGRREIQRGMEEWRATGAEYLMPYFLAQLAQVEQTAKQPQNALPMLEEARIRVGRTGECWYEAEIHRLEGEVLVALDRLADAKACFARALDTAAGQQARFWELRAALSLWRLGHDPAARDRVVCLKAGFSEGFELPDLKASRLLAPDQTPS